jgi:YD repeat-containing protein
MEFIVAADGTGQSFTDANIAEILSNAQCSTYVNGALATVVEYEISGDTITFNRYLRTDDIVSIAAFGVTNMAVTGAGGATTQLQFNDAGNLRGITTATYNGTALTLGSNAQVKITGGTVGQSLVTDGTGNLSWSSTASAAGLDTELQYNNAGASAGIPTATYDGTVLTLGAVDEVSITGGTAGQALITDGAGVLSFGETMMPGWNNVGPVLIGATVTAPTKGGIVNDFTRYRKIAPREYQVQYVYNQNTAGSAGNGEYLFTLPAGLSFDLTSPGQTIVTVTTDAVRNGGIPGGSAGMICASQPTGGPFVVPAIVIPYSATQFRVLAFNAFGGTTGSIGPMSSMAYKLSETQISMNLDFSFIATA